MTLDLAKSIIIKPATHNYGLGRHCYSDEELKIAVGGAK